MISHIVVQPKLCHIYAAYVKSPTRCFNLQIFPQILVDPNIFHLAGFSGISCVPIFHSIVRFERNLTYHLLAKHYSCTKKYRTYIICLNYIQNQLKHSGFVMKGQKPWLF